MDDQLVECPICHKLVEACNIREHLAEHELERMTLGEV